MIIGIGTDIVEVERIKSSVENYGEKFLNKIFTPLELEYALNKKSKYLHLAARFAAKEAVVKALAECCDKGFVWKDIEIYNNENGAPFVKLKGKFAEYMGETKEIKITLSHSENYAVAFAILFEKK